MEHPVKPTAARRSCPRWSSTTCVTGPSPRLSSGNSTPGRSMRYRGACG